MSLRLKRGGSNVARLATHLTYRAIYFAVRLNYTLQVLWRSVSMFLHVMRFYRSDVCGDIHRFQMGKRS